MSAAKILAVGTGTILFYCLFPAHLAAQDEPSPKEPMVPRAPDMASWTVTYKYKQASPNPQPDPDAKQKPPDQIVSIQTQKTGKIYHSVTVWSSGARSDAWNVNQKTVLKGKTANNYVVMPNEGPATDDYSKSDFEDLAWITMKYYAGLKKGDQPVFVFQAKNSERPLTRREKYSLVLLNLPHSTSLATKPSSGSSPAKEDPKPTLEQIFGDSTATVVLDAKTQLPVAYDDGKMVLTYQFTTPPTSSLVPPAEVATILRRLDDYIKGTTVRPSQP